MCENGVVKGFMHAINLMEILQLRWRKVEKLFNLNDKKVYLCSYLVDSI